jgi:hypothetical protein
MYNTCSGAILSITSLVLFVLIGLLLFYKNVLLVTATSAVTTALLMYEPTGLFQVQIVVAGLGIDELVRLQ